MTAPPPPLPPPLALPLLLLSAEPGTLTDPRMSTPSPLTVPLLDGHPVVCASTSEQALAACAEETLEPEETIPSPNTVEQNKAVPAVSNKLNLAMIPYLTARDNALISSNTKKSPGSQLDRVCLLTPQIPQMH